MRFLLLLALLTTHQAALGQDFVAEHLPLAGLYETDDGGNLLVGLYGADELFFVSDPATGWWRLLEQTGPGEYAYGPSRSVTQPTVGAVVFREGSLSIRSEGLSRNGVKLALKSSEIRFQNGSAQLVGELISPSGEGPFPTAVLIPQSDRYNLLEVGYWLLSAGVAVFIYDQRNTGGSVGDEVSGYNHEQQRIYASDALAAVDAVRARPESTAVGVLGWSGGGWMAGMVAGERPDLAFFVNIAGNASSGLDQAQHRFVSRLYRDGFPDSDIEAADAFLTLHHDVARGLLGWDEYVPLREAVSKTSWYESLTNRFNMTYDDLEDARKWGSAVESAPAEADFARVTVPTLGVFFEFDHSTTPETPLIFHRALQAAGNGDYTVVLIPNAHHGGFEVEGYRWDSNAFDRRRPELVPTITEWISRHVAPARGGLD